MNSPSSGNLLITRPMRVAWIDFARLLCILFVIQYHSPLHLKGGNSLLAGASVCAFYFLAGYFNKKKGKELFRRCLYLFLFCQIWEIVFLILVSIHHTLKGIPFNMWYAYVFSHASIRQACAMWFLEYLVFWMLLSPIFFKLKLRWLQFSVILGLFGIWVYNYVYISPKPDSHVSYSLSAAFFYLGCSMQKIPVMKLGEKLFLYTSAIPYKCYLLLNALIFCGFISAIQLQHNIVAPGNNGWFLFPLAYVILSLAFYTEKVLPTFSAFCARTGPAIICIYGLHDSCLYLYTATWSYMMKESISPPHLLTILLLLALICSSTIAYKKFKGKSHILDFIFFAS